MLDQRLEFDAQLGEPTRRSGDRRRQNVAVDRDNRTGDRRRNTPGLKGLIGDLFAR
jgi:hypothetical protein